MNILHTENLSITFKRQGKIIKAVDGINIALKEGKVTALAGESGCGKTTLAKTILGFIKPSCGKIWLNGQDLTLKLNKKMITKNIQIVFQNPYLSFDPRFKIFDSLYEAMSADQKISGLEAKKEIIQALSNVELAKDLLERYPHQLSGGQLQRISIARALLKNPSILILDEPTSSLDVTTSAKIISLLKRLQFERKVTFLFISHNLKLLKKISDFTYIMRQGRIIESGESEKIFTNPQQTYTRALIAAGKYQLK